MPGGAFTDVPGCVGVLGASLEAEVYPSWLADDTNLLHASTQCNGKILAFQTCPCTTQDRPVAGQQSADETAVKNTPTKAKAGTSINCVWVSGACCSGGDNAREARLLQCTTNNP